MTRTEFSQTNKHHRHYVKLIAAQWLWSYLGFWFTAVLCQGVGNTTSTRRKTKTYHFLFNNHIPVSNGGKTTLTPNLIHLQLLPQALNAHRSHFPHLQGKETKTQKADSIRPCIKVRLYRRTQASPVYLDCAVEKIK